MKELFCDGVAGIALSHGMVFLDLFHLVSSPKGPSERVPFAQIILPWDGFLGLLDTGDAVKKRLTEVGIFVDVPENNPPQAAAKPAPAKKSAAKPAPAKKPEASAKKPAAKSAPAKKQEAPAKPAAKPVAPAKKQEAPVKPAVKPAPAKKQEAPAKPAAKPVAPAKKPEAIAKKSAPAKPAVKAKKAK